MTCIRLDNGQTLHSYCKENNLPYMIMWLRIEKGMAVKDAMKPPYSDRIKYYIDGVSAFRKLSSAAYQRWRVKELKKKISREQVV